MRLPRFFASIRFWVALCVAVRLVALLTLPIKTGAFQNRAMAETTMAPTGYLHFLQRRTEFAPLTEDEHCYDAMAQNIRSGRGFVVDFVWIITTPGQPAMYGGCGYPLFVASVYSLFGNGSELPVALLQILLEGAAVALIFQTGKALAGEAAATVSSAFFTFHPVVIWVSIALMSEAILVPAMAALLWIITCRPMTFKWAAILGALLAVMALTRSTTAALVWLAAGWMGLTLRKKSGPAITALLLTFGVICAPWTIRNYYHWHRFIPFSTKSGVNAWFFNHPGLKVEFSRAAVEGPQPIDVFDPRIQSLPDEAARNDELMSMFKNFARENPAKFAGLCWIRFWMALLPARITSTSGNALVSAWYAKGIPFTVLTLFGLLRLKSAASQRLPKSIWFVLLAAAYWQAIQSLAGPGLRYRLPVEPAWALITGIAVVGIASMLKGVEIQRTHA